VDSQLTQDRVQLLAFVSNDTNPEFHKTGDLLDQHKSLQLLNEDWNTELLGFLQKATISKYNLRKFSSLPSSGTPSETSPVPYTHLYSATLLDASNEVSPVTEVKQHWAS
jgi:hypothetical protein